jgi:coenzyme F420-reducing hydrogenase delta subunit
MFNMSSAMASQFVEATKEMTAQITQIGPNPLRRRKAEG